MYNKKFKEIPKWVINAPPTPLEEILLNIDCQPGGGGVGFEEKNWKNVTLCHSCWHKLEPDMWTCQEHYKALNPIIPYDELPNLYND
jgi:hypothetical protein